jgi:anti-sigma factor RsiW
LNDDQHIPYEALGRYLSGRLDRDERASIERHLEDCAFCRQDLADAQAWQAELAAKATPSWWQKLLGRFR